MRKTGPYACFSLLVAVATSITQIPVSKRRIRAATVRALSILGIVFWFATASLLAQTGAVPVVPINSVVNNASYAPGSNALAPGTIAAIFGTNLTDGTSCVHAAGCDQTFDSTGHLRTTMAGAQVTINGSPVPIFYATPVQLGIQIPSELTGTSATLQVTVNGQSSPARTFSIGPFAPGIFTSNQQGTGSEAITHADGTTVSSGNPARPGETVIIYATGLGQVTPALATGTRPTGTVSTLTIPTVTIDGLSAVVQFSGISGCCVGLNQVIVAVPANVRTGTAVNVVLSIGGRQSNTVTLAIASSPPPPPPSPPPPPPPPPPPGILSGSWRGFWTSRNGLSGSLSASITQTGTSLTGTVLSSVCSGGTFYGTLSGPLVSLTAVFPRDRTVFPDNDQVNFTGTVNSANNLMVGTYASRYTGSLCGGDTGNWSLGKVN